MAYVTLTQLAELPGALELSQVAGGRDERPVATELMDATLRGGDRSAFPPSEVAKADAALERIQEATRQADAIIDGYLARRYRLPLGKVVPLLAVWSRSITRYLLHPDRQTDERTDPIVRDYRDAIRLLQETAQEKFHLGIEDPTTSTGSAGEFIFHAGNKVFGREGRP
ncbi:DUF1320 domain-containing protein [Stenotrophomonas sp. C-A]|nr:DUF1320 domain-containing protein [Stenotrophomonas maltophilia]